MEVDSAFKNDMLSQIQTFLLNQLKRIILYYAVEEVETSL